MKLSISCVVCSENPLSRIAAYIDSMLIDDVLFNSSSDMIFYAIYNSARKVTLFFRDVQEKGDFWAIFLKKWTNSCVTLLSLFSRCALGCLSVK